MDINQIYGDYNKALQDQIAQAQAQAQPQGGVLSQVDPTWLALAQGFLAPTKTGGFGESLGNAAGALQGPLAKMKEQQLSAQDRINKLREMQMRLALDTYKAQKSDSDLTMDIYRDLRNEKLVNSLYGEELKNAERIAGNVLATDEERANAQRKVEEIKQKIEEHKNRLNLGRGSPQPQQATPQQGNAQPQQRQPSAQPQEQPRTQQPPNADALRNLQKKTFNIEGKQIEAYRSPQNGKYYAWTGSQWAEVSE